ncbi:AzlD domain-containing protein [Citricoccus sp.]|uniref:branched-chain amino acid transporter permease n=1 Tax=Citricoccus sp. TaxID=1978372 RepID=UPI0028BD9CBD|nr:AzlD domain-containing protein [Citricoccus sp.]
MVELDPWYVAGALAIAFAITLSLRALPFAVLRPLRKSRLVMAMGLWMPVGILGILAASTFVSTASVDWATAVKAVVAVAVTAAVHLWCGRRTLLSIGLGTLTFVALVNFL